MSEVHHKCSLCAHCWRSTWTTPSSMLCPYLCLPFSSQIGNTIHFWPLFAMFGERARPHPRLLLTSSSDTRVLRLICTEIAPQKMLNSREGCRVLTPHPTISRPFHQMRGDAVQGKGPDGGSSQPGSCMRLLFFAGTLALDGGGGIQCTDTPLSYRLRAALQRQDARIQPHAHGNATRSQDG